MNTTPLTRELGRLLRYFLVLLLPLIHENGQLWVLSIASAATIYEGQRSSVVYRMLALIIVIEIIYGTPLGVMSISYIGAVIGLAAVRWFISIPAWSEQDGWRSTDALRTALVSMFMYCGIVVMSVVIANVLSNTGFLIERTRLLFTLQSLIVPFVLSMVIPVMLRRTHVPFYPEIRYGI